MPKQRQDPIRSAITPWLNSITLPSQPPASVDDLLSLAPKRFIIYEPMAQLPAGSFAQPEWVALLDQQEEEDRARLWLFILDALSRRAGSRLTHLAVTAGIPLHRTEKSEQEGEEENVLRSPTGLRMLYGDFGPTPGEHGQHIPGPGDFEKTLWVSTKQNGIYQTWAPKWTMFSRGNVKEKARLLAFPSSSKDKTGHEEHRQDEWAVDLYAGIGYFVFSYAALGFKVLCWELNPWSVEGLRRGAEANRWTVKIVQGENLDVSMEDIMAGGEQIIVFLEDNQKALSRIRHLHTLGMAREVKHVNCGFLPTSEPTWRAVWDITSCSDESWLHLHKNVGIHDTEHQGLSIQAQYSQWSEEDCGSRVPKAEHVELVKSYAPGVWHCVFDVHITR